MRIALLIALACAAPFFTRPVVAQTDESVPAVLMARAAAVIRPETGTDRVAERSALAHWLRHELPDLGVNLVTYGMNQWFFPRLFPEDDCERGCGDGRYPIPFDADDLPRASGILNGIAPFDLAGDVDLLLGPHPLADPFRSSYISIDCPDRSGLVAGEDGDCACRLSYRGVLEYLTGMFQALKDGGSTAAWSHVRGVQFNLEFYAFPKTRYAVDGPRADFKESHPGICEETIHRFNDAFGHTAGLDGGGSLEAFLEDVEFDYPEMSLDAEVVDRWGEHHFGICGRPRAIAQTFIVTDDAICRVDLQLRRTSAKTWPPKHLQYFLCGVRNGVPSDALRLSPRGCRREWVPAAFEDDEGRPVWVSLYVDPVEAAARFDPGDRVAIVVSSTLGCDRSGDAAYAVRMSHRDRAVPVGSASALEISWHNPPRWTSRDVRQLDADMSFRVWTSREPESDAHDDYVRHQNARVGRILEDVRAALDRVDPRLEIWAFLQIPSRYGFSIERREGYGSDLTEPRTARYLDGIITVPDQIDEVHELDDGGAKPALSQLTSYDTDVDPGEAFDALRRSFASGGLSMWQGRWAPSGTKYRTWKDDVIPRMHAVTAPIQLFPEHYVAAGRGHYPDSTAVATRDGHVEVFRLLCPPEVCEDGLVGHALLSVPKGNSRGSGSFNLLDALPESWLESRSADTVRLDSLTIYRDRPFVGSRPGDLDATVICGADTKVPMHLPRWDQWGSVAIVEKRPPRYQPGQFTAAPAGSICVDAVVRITWRPMPASCREALELRDISVTIDLERRDPGGGWREWHRLAAGQEVPARSL